MMTKFPLSVRVALLEFLTVLIVSIIHPILELLKPTIMAAFNVLSGTNSIIINVTPSPPVQLVKASIRAPIIVKHARQVALPA
jgi:hypothetical protein